MQTLYYFAGIANCEGSEVTQKLIGQFVIVAISGAALISALVVLRSIKQSQYTRNKKIFYGLGFSLIVVPFFIALPIVILSFFIIPLCD